MATGHTGRRRNPLGLALAVLTRLAGSTLIDRWGLRKPTQRAVFGATKAGYRGAAAVSRTFTAATRLAAPARTPATAPADLFDLTPTEEQRLAQQVAAEFAEQQLRPAAAQADAESRAPAQLLARSAELGLTLIGVPTQLGGAGSERPQLIHALLAEALAHGDMGLAVACLAPAAVSTALSMWGDEQQQSTYLPAFVGEHVPAAALALLEPHPLADPFAPRTTARSVPGGGFVLDGVKSLVPRAAEAELFVISADLDGTGPALLLVESGSAGITVDAQPAMGLRAAAMAQLRLHGVRLPATALLGGGQREVHAQREVYAQCVALSRLGWCALAVGTGQAVLDYVVPYVNGRVAFGEPISHRQSVAFAVADMGIELDGMRLVTYRAAARASSGLPFAREVALARRLCADRGMRIGSDGVQLLGGHGFVKEHPVQRWYRDLRAVGVMEGGVLL